MKYEFIAQAIYKLGIKRVREIVYGVQETTSNEIVALSLFINSRQAQVEQSIREQIDLETA